MAAPHPGTHARKTAILEAALACFSRRGIEATTIGDICQAAACSTGSLYHHFGSKEGVASGLFVSVIGTMHRELVAKLRRCPSAEAGVRTVVVEYCHWVTSNRELARYLVGYRDIAFTDTARQRIKRMYLDHIAAICEWFQPFIRQGRMKQLPSETYIPIIMGPIQDYVRHWLMGRYRLAPIHVRDVFATAAWNAVKDESDAARPAASSSGRGVDAA